MPDDARDRDDRAPADDPARADATAGGGEEPARPEEASAEDEPPDAPSDAPSDADEADPEEAEPEEPEEPEEEEAEEIRFADAEIASEDELRAALAWAFESEDVEASLLDTFARHARLVLEAARTTNLTKIIEPREVAAKHYLDSWRSIRLLPLVGRSLVDIGSGAGFPGVPIALTEPHTRVVLVESKGKKAAFLERSVEEIGIKNVTVVHDRAEEHLARNRYDVAILRAISSVRENVRMLRKVRHSIQDLVMLKGPSWSREVRAGEREAERLGFRLDTVWEHELPGGLGARAVLVYRAPGGHGRL